MIFETAGDIPLPMMVAISKNIIAVSALFANYINNSGAEVSC